MKKGLLLAAVAVLAIAAVVTLQLEAVVKPQLEAVILAALDPGVPFDAGAAPSAPDYTNPAAWTALPAREDSADIAPSAWPARDQTTAEVDVFYVHPTSYVGPLWNGPVNDPELNAATDELATLIQATVFNACCAIYGPRYRQANGRAFLQPDSNGRAAIDVAYTDVRDAFRSYRKRVGGNRPFLIAAHSQGSVLAARLLREEISPTPLRRQLVAAYLIGGPIDDSPRLGIPTCESATQTGCVVAWNARGPHFEENVFDFHTEHMEGERLCVNPLTWRHDESRASAALNRGAVFLHAGDGTVAASFASAQCRDGWLIAEEIGPTPRDFMSRILDWIMGPESYHPIEYQLYWVNLRLNANARAAAFVASNP